MNLIIRTSNTSLLDLRYAARLDVVSHVRLVGLVVGEESVTSPRLDVACLFVDEDAARRAVDSLTSSLATGARICDLRPYTRPGDDDGIDVATLRRFLIIRARKAAEADMTDGGDVYADAGGEPEANVDDRDSTLDGGGPYLAPRPGARPLSTFPLTDGDET